MLNEIISSINGVNYIYFTNHSTIITTILSNYHCKCYLLYTHVVRQCTRRHNYDPGWASRSRRLRKLKFTIWFVCIYILIVHSLLHINYHFMHISPFYSMQHILYTTIIDMSLRSNQLQMMDGWWQCAPLRLLSRTNPVTENRFLATKRETKDKRFSINIGEFRVVYRDSTKEPKASLVQFQHRIQELFLVNYSL